MAEAPAAAPANTKDTLLANIKALTNVVGMRDVFEEAISFNQPLHAPWYNPEG